MTHSPTPPLDLDAIRKRCEAATAGPWSAEDADQTDPLIRSGRTVVVGFDTGDWDAEPCWLVSDADQQFIAHARTDIPALLSEVERLRAGIASLGECSECHDEAMALLAALTPDTETER